MDIIRKNQAATTPNLSDYEKTYQEFSWEKVKKELSYFEDGTFNAAYNAIDRHAESNRKDKVALIYEGVNGEKENYTFSQMAKLTNKFANVLVKQGIVKGDRVFIFLPPVPARYIAFLGTLKVGAIASNLFAAFQEKGLFDRLSDSGARMVVTDSVLFPRIEKIWKDLPNLEKIILVENGTTEMPKESRLISYKQTMAEAQDTFPIAHLKQEDPAYMLYTSGTTGKPKGVMHAHGDILQGILTTLYVLDVKDSDIYWCTADAGWVTGIVYGILGIWGAGATSVVFEGRFSPESWYKILQDYKVTIWYTAPTAIRMLMGSPVSVKQYDLSHLRHLLSVGEPLNPEAIKWGMEVFGLPFHDTWWQTETGAICVTNFPCMDIKPGSMGKPFPGVKAAIVDDEGRELPANTSGHLALKPETVNSLMKQIWQNPEKFKSYFVNGWYISGDQAYKDNDGYFWFVGREDDVIKTSGERVGPFEVESVLDEHPQVMESGVIGKPDPLRGQIVKAFVVLKGGAEASEALKEEIAQFVKKKLSGFAYPREIEFIDKLPKTRSGKIMRRLLRAKELGLPEGDTSTLEEF